MAVRRLTAGLPVLITFALASAGCKSQQEPAAETAPQTAPEPAVAAPPDAKAVAPADGDPPAAPELPEVEADTTALDPLLNLVPKASAGFILLHDPNALLSLVHPFAHAGFGTVPRFVTKAEDIATIKAKEAKYTELRTLLEGPELAADKGMIVFEVGGETVVVYAASKPTALTTIVADLFDVPAAAQCEAVGSAPGYIACAEAQSTIAAYVPGNDAAALREKVTKDLPGVDLGSANVVAHLQAIGVPMVVATPPGRFEIMFGVPELPPQVTKFSAPGPATALGLLDAGAAFGWGRVGIDAAKGAVPAGTPPIVATTLDALTGELLLGSLGESRGVGLVAGARDQEPIAGLIGLASTQIDKIPKALPDGSKVAVTLESLELAGKPTQVLHGRMTPSAASASTYAAVNFNPEGWAFGAGPYAGLLFGADAKGLEALAGATPAGPSAALLATLPPALGAALTAERVVFAVHAPFDGLAQFFGEDISALTAGQLPPEVAEAGIDVPKIILNLGTTVAPLSAVTQWIEVREGRWVGRLAVSVFGDARSDDGRAALAAIDKLLAGEKSSTVYGALADAHEHSPRGHSYVVRAGRAVDGTLVSTALVGMLAAIAVPAFTKFAQRARGAAEAASP